MNINYDCFLTIFIDMAVEFTVTESIVWNPNPTCTHENYAYEEVSSYYLVHIR